MLHRMAPCTISRRPAQGRRRRGAAIVLALVAVAIGFAMGFMFVASAATLTGTATLMNSHAQARQIAESGVMMALRYIEANDNWRDARTSGTWVSDLDVLGGNVTISAEYDDSLMTGTIAVPNASFEAATGQLANPLLNPPMSGAVGGWTLTRTALLPTNLTVPSVGVRASGTASDGAREAFISFNLSVVGGATISRELAPSVQPETQYDVTVDIAVTGFVMLQRDYGFRIKAGSTVIAATEHAWTLQLPALPQIDLQAPEIPPLEPELNALLETLILNNGYAQYHMQFTTTDDPPAGPLTLELFANSIGLIAQAAFDNVRLEMTADGPLLLTAVAHHGDASSRVSATVRPADGTIVAWSEE